MNLKKLFNLTIFFFLFAALSSSTFAQVYVDATNGNDGTGAGTIASPYASIAKGLSVLPVTGGTVVLKAGWYDGATLAGGVDINIAAGAVMGAYTMPAFSDGATITFQLSQLAGNDEVKIYDAGNTNATGPDFTFNIKNGTLNFVSSNGSEYLNLSDTQSDLNLGSAGKSVSVGINTATGASATNVLLRNGATITLNESSAFTNYAPTKTTNVSVTYANAGNQSVGLNAFYTDYGTGTLTVNKTLATQSVTFPAANITKVTGGINIIEGAVTFNGDVNTNTGGTVTIAGGGNVNFANLTTGGATNISGTGAVNLTSLTAGGAVSVAAGSRNITLTTLAMGLFDFTHAGTGEVKVNGNMTLQAGINGGTDVDADLGSIEVTAAGKFTVVGTTTWSGVDMAAAATFTGAGEYAVVNSNDNATVTLGAVSLIPNNATTVGGTNNFTIEFANLEDGTLIVGAITAAATATNAYVGTVHIINGDAAGDASKTTFSGTVRGNVTNTAAAATSKITVAAATMVYGVVDNDAASTITLNGDLTLKGAVAHTLATTSTINGTGTLILDGATELTINGVAGAAAVGNVQVVTATKIAGDDGVAATTAVDRTLTINGNLTIGANLTLGAIHGTDTDDGVVTVTGTTTLNAGTFTIDATTITTPPTNLTNTFVTKNFVQTGGTITLDNVLSATDAGVLKVSGDFLRSAGTFTATDIAALVELNGTAAQSFNGGPMFQVAKFTVSNVGGLVSLANTIRSSNVFTVNAGATIELENNNIVFNAATSKMVNNGTIQTTGITNGAIIFGGANFVAGGLNVDGMVLNASSSAVFSNIIIDVNSANDVITTGSAGNIRWTKVLNLYSGDLNNNTAVDLAPMGTVASITRNVSLTGSTNGILLAGGGTFNTAAVDYDLTYTGTLAADKTINTTTSVEWDNDNIRNLTNSAGGASSAIVLAGNQDRTLKGNLTITGSATAASASRLTGDNGDLTVLGNMNVGQNSVVLLANTAGTDLTITGNLTLSASSNIGTGNAGSVILFDGDNTTHSILGNITAVSILTVDANNVTFNGQAASATANVSEIANFVLAADASATLSQLHAINGVVTTGANTSLVLGLTQTSSAAPVDNADGNGTVAGLITLGGNSFTLASNIEAQAGLDHNLGSFAFGNYNLTLTTAGALDRADVASTTYSSTGGKLISKVAATYDFSDAIIPYWTVDNVTITLGDTDVDTKAGVTVSQGLVIQGAGPGVIANGGFDVTIQNNMTTVGGAVFTGTGNLVLAGTTVTASGSPTFSNMEVNSTGTATLASSVPATGRTFTITGVLTHTLGTLSIGNNHVTLTGTAADAYDRTAGLFLAGDGQLIFAGAADQTFNPGAGWSVPNLTLNNTAASGTELTTAYNQVFTVTGKLRLVDGYLHTQDLTPASKDNLLALGNGSMIYIDASQSGINEVPTFEGLVDVHYITAGGIAGNELPVSTDKLNKLIIDPTGANTIQFTVNTTVNNTLYLKSGALDLTTAVPDAVLTLANGATIEVIAGTIDAAPVVTSYNLVYNTTAPYTTGLELVPNSVANMTVNSTGADLLLGSATNITGNFTINSAAGNNFDLNAFNFGIAGNVSFTKGNIANSGGTLAQLSLNGAAAQNLTVPAAGLTFPAAVAGDDGVELVINNTSTAGVTLLNGNLSMQNTNPVTFVNVLRFIQGTLTTNSNIVFLWHTDDGVGNPVQGFARSVAVGNYSHVVGNVRKYLDITGLTAAVRLTRVEFPVGTAPTTTPAAPGYYRPMSFQFNTLPTANFNLTVNNVVGTPGGVNGFGTDAFKVDGNPITNYPDLYWLVTSSLTLQPTVKYDIEARADGYTDYQTDGVQNIRLIRRFDTNTDNPWIVQGGSGYDNSSFDYLNTAPLTDDSPIIIVRAAEGAISTQGARFTYSQLNKAPVLSTPADLTVAENAAAAITWTVTDPDIAQVPTFTGIVVTATPPAVAPTAGTGAGQYQFVNGAFTWTPTFTQSGVYTLTVTATDGTLSSSDAVQLTVTDADVPVTFSAPTAGVASTMTVVEGSTTEVQFTAASEGTVVLELVSQTPAAPVVGTFDALTGKLTLAPNYAAAVAEANTNYVFVVKGTSPFGKTQNYTLTVTVTNANQAPVAVATAASATVNYGTPGVITFTATDGDGTVPTFGHVVDNALTNAPTVVDNAGTYTITINPATADINKTFTFSVTATDGTSPSNVVTTAVTVTSDLVGTPAAPRVYGDVDGLGGTPDLGDVLAVLDFWSGNNTTPPTPAELWAADVNGNGNVDLQDALLILEHYFANPKPLFPVEGGSLPKLAAVNSQASFGKMASEDGTIAIPVNISSTTDVSTIGLEFDISGGVEEVTTSANMPSDWMTKSYYKDGKLKVALIGLSDLKNANIATIYIKLTDKEAVAKVNGIVSINGSEQAVAELQVKEIPTEFTLVQNYPNPFNPTTVIKYAITEPSQVKLSVYDITGQKIATLVNTVQEAGNYRVTWNSTNNYGQSVAAGVYIYRLEAGSFVSTKKMMLVK
ncbi:MAG: T9SS type A sorting domain-containing protein [Bacteroidetes bacterium]|nr:T9SS type A sorting domain-containing protein [Bacteroidota bacterium]